MAISNILTYENYLVNIEKDDLWKNNTLNDFSKKYLSMPIKDSFSSQFEDYTDLLKYIDNIDLYPPINEVVIQKRWSSNKKFDITVSYDPSLYNFWLDVSDFYKPIYFNILDKTFKKHTKNVSTSSNPETYEKMAYKYSQLVECIENRYDLSLEDLIMRF